VSAHSFNDLNSSQCVASPLPQSSSDQANNLFLSNQDSGGIWNDFNLHSTSTTYAPQLSNSFLSHDLLSVDDHFIPDLSTPQSYLGNSNSNSPFPTDYSTTSSIQSSTPLVLQEDLTTFLPIINQSTEPTHLPSTTTTTSNSIITLKPNTQPTISTKPGRKRSSNQEDDDQRVKRLRNNAAAAKYRQKKVDRIDALEKELTETSKERDDLKLQLAKRDAELDLLKRLLMGK
jgi:basic region leucine zipper protein